MRIVLSIDVPLDIDDSYDANEICQDLKIIIENYVDDTVAELRQLADSGEEDSDDVESLASEFKMMKSSIQAIVWGTGKSPVKNHKDRT
jgi:hypothetical protein